MKKIISLVAIAFGLLATINANAQSKIGYIRIDDVVGLMPEAAKIDTMLQKYQSDSLNQTLNNIVQEYQYKDSMLTKVDTTKTPKQVLNQLRTDVNVLAYQIQNWQSLAGQAYENKQQQLLAPLYNKAITSCKLVAKEKGYAYVLSKDAFLVAPRGDDMLPAVAAKLGVKDSCWHDNATAEDLLPNRINKLLQLISKASPNGGASYFCICLHKIQLVFLIPVLEDYCLERDRKKAARLRLYLFR